MYIFNEQYFLSLPLLLLNTAIVYLFFVEVEIVECNQMLTQSDGLVLSSIHKITFEEERVLITPQFSLLAPEYKESRAILNK